MRYIKTYKVYEAEFGEIIDNVITECIDLR